MENEPNIVVNDELIARYLAGEANPLEAIALHEWCALSLENELYFKQLQYAWQAAVPSTVFVAPDLSQDWQQLEQLIDAPQDQERQDTQVRRIPSDPKKLLSGHWIFRLAAGLVLVLGAGVLLYKMTNSVAVRVNMTSVVAQSNAILENKLPDNSHVILSPSSKITYEKDFKGDVRKIELIGEAYFQVTPDTQKPFVIHASKAQIRVVGTAFNVNAKGNAVVVSVTSGKVQFSAGDTAVFLTKGKTGVWHKAENNIEVVSAINQNALGYATHRLDFHSTALKYVISDIEKMYSCKILVKNHNLADCPFTATFVDMSLEEVLSIVAEEFTLKIKKANTHEFYLEGGGCP